MKIVFYYAGMHNSNVPFAGTCVAMLNAARACVRHGFVVVLCGDRITQDEYYEGLKISKERCYLADILVMCSVDTAYYACTIPLKFYYANCWDEHWVMPCNIFKAIFCVSSSHLANMRRFYPSNLLRVVKHFVNPDMFMAYLPKEKREKVVLYSGAISAHKGIGNLVLAVQSIPNCKLYICGSSRMWGEDDGFSFPSSVAYFGEIKNKRMNPCYNVARVLCTPSKLESFGLASIESQLCGCVSCVTPFGGARETIKEGKTGIVLEGTDTQDIVEGINAAFALFDSNSLDETAAFVKDNYTDSDSFYKVLEEFL